MENGENSALTGQEVKMPTQFAWDDGPKDK